MRSFALLTGALLVLAGPASAQGLKLPKLTGHPSEDFQEATASVRPAKADPAAPLPCMDIRVLTKLTPDNLVPTFRGCKIEVIGQLVKDTSAALESAKAFTGSATGTASNSSAPVGDNDAINCLTPALALFKAAMPTQAVAAQDAVPAQLNADGSVKVPAIPAVPAVPANDPGPVLLYQKYREFTLAGALTSCQAWFNGPINATAAAGLAGAATAVGAVGLLAPK